MRFLRARSTRTAILSLLFSVAVLVLAPVSTGADPYGDPNPGYKADGNDHWYCFSGGATFDRNRVTTSMQYLDTNTNLYDVYTSTCGS